METSNSNPTKGLILVLLLLIFVTTFLHSEKLNSNYLYTYIFDQSLSMTIDLQWTTSIGIIELVSFFWNPQIVKESTKIELNKVEVNKFLVIKFWDYLENVILKGYFHQIE